ncbi:hypothetical protein LINGRAHAP2_LOCUS36731 [Linum grandiflorum]|jgi:hypothetical protein
MLSVT